MAQLRQPVSATPLSRPLSAEFAPTSNDAQESILYSILPSVLKTRLPRLPSFRRSVSMYQLGTRRKSADSRPSTGTSSGSSTPGGYTSAMVLSDLKGIDGDDKVLYYVDGSNEEGFGTSTPMERRGSRLELTEVKSGIGWKFAHQGFNLLTIAADESSTITHNSSLGNAPLARQLYLHAITYLLQALPSDLTTEEKLSVRSSLPVGVVQPLLLTDSHLYTSQTRTNTSGPPSLLHRTLASSIVQLFIIFQFVLPYLKHMLGAAYQYDRTHKISERALSQGVVTVNGLTKAGFSISGIVYGINDGRMGRKITETAAWVLEGVTGGIHEGVGEGLFVVGAVPRRDQRLGTEMR